MRTAPSCPSRATSVPFTAVLTGPQGATTDNAMPVLTCAVRYRRRWQSRSIWLCKQVVIGQGLHRRRHASGRSGPLAHKERQERQEPNTRRATVAAADSCMAGMAWL
jgi:hypothetical protein